MYKWDEHLQCAFMDVKQYLTNPLVFATLILEKLLILYITALHDSLGFFLAQINKEGKDNVLYYLSQYLNPFKVNYRLMKRIS